MKLPVVLCFIGAIALGGRVSLGADGASTPGPANASPSAPDLSNFDADTLRTLATRLYGAVDDLQKKLKAATQALAASKAEAAKLRHEVAQLKKQVADLESQAPVASQPAPVAIAPLPVPLNPTPIQKAILDQDPPFEKLNAGPREFLGKKMTLRGYAEPTDHQSGGIFQDQDVPRKFIAMIDFKGQRIFVSFPAESNAKLFELVGQASASHRVAVKVEATGISTREEGAFEAAGDKWEAMK